MSTPFLGEIALFSFEFAPKGWAQTNGQLLPINQNQALFAILGTFYGGNGIQNFALPNLQGRSPISFGAGFVQGQIGGEESHTLSTSEIPAHTHTAMASTDTADQSASAGNIWANGNNAYNSDSDKSMNAIASTGGSQPHENRPPFLTLNFCIALQGIFPSRN
jgi:microcystin-dependent protein